MKLETALDRYTTQLQADGRAASTVAQYVRHVTLFSHWSREVGHSGDLSKITHEIIAEFLASKLARTRRYGGVKTATSMNVLRSSLKAFFSYSHIAGFISCNPGRLIRRAICASPPPRTLSEKESAKLMATLAEADGYESRRDHLLFHLMLATGIRLASAVGLDAEDVDLERSQVLIRNTKGNRPEWVILGKKIRAHLRCFLRNHPSGPLFTNRMDQRLSHRQVQRRFQLWREKAEIPPNITVHCTRHTFATRLYQKTGDVFLVKEALKHRSIASTLVYAEPQHSRLRLFLS